MAVVLVALEDLVAHLVPVVLVLALHRVLPHLHHNKSNLTCLNLNLPTIDRAHRPELGFLEPRFYGQRTLRQWLSIKRSKVKGEISKSGLYKPAL
jgi:hypothetical protein